MSRVCFQSLKDNDPQGPWCYTTDPDKRYEYCDVPLCERPSPGKVQFPTECGVSVFKEGSILYKNGSYNYNAEGASARIFGATDNTPEKAFPWQVSLIGPAGCGGTIISSMVA